LRGKGTKLRIKNSTDQKCQSCGLSLEQDEKGTEVDGTLNEHYCNDCYENGDFIEPEITLKEMIEKTVTSASKSRNITMEEAKNYLEFLLPTLKRWQ
jgi:NAD-dependent SIR2 family protein deacetylase